MPDQILEIRMVAGRIRIARKAKHRDAGDLQQAPEPVGAEGEITEFLGAYLYNRDLCCKATGSLLQNNRALTRIPRPACPTGRPRPPFERWALVAGDVGIEVAERDQLLSLDRAEPHPGDRDAPPAPLSRARHSFRCRWPVHD